MADQTPGTRDNTAEGPRATNPADTKAAAQEAQHGPNKSGEPSNPAAQADNDPVQELLERLHRAQLLIANIDRHLAQTIQTLTQQGEDPERRAQPSFRHQVAYTLQDLEKYPVRPIQITPELRSEMTRLAATAPGLENDRMLALMRETAVLEDKRLINDIRRTGMDAGAQRDQNAPDIRSQIEVLENRVRLSQRRPEPTAADQHADQSRLAPAADNMDTARPLDAAPDRPAHQRGPWPGNNRPTREARSTPSSRACAAETMCAEPPGTRRTRRWPAGLPRSNAKSATAPASAHFSEPRGPAERPSTHSKLSAPARAPPS